MRWLLLTLAATLGGACWTGASPEPTTTNSSLDRSPSRARYQFDSLTLERTGCLGACPIYTVTIYANGAVRWVGEANVASMGMRTGRISRGQIHLLERKLDAIRFFEYDQNGHKPAQPACTQTRVTNGTTTTMTTTCNFSGVVVCSDTSHAIVTLVRDRKEHRVDNAHCDLVNAPLNELEQLIDDAAGTRDWVGG